VTEIQRSTRALQCFYMSTQSQLVGLHVLRHSKGIGAHPLKVDHTTRRGEISKFFPQERHLYKYSSKGSKRPSILVVAIYLLSLGVSYLAL